VQAESITHGMQHAAHGQLGPRITCSHSGHYLAPHIRRIGEAWPLGPRPRAAIILHGTPQSVRARAGAVLFDPPWTYQRRQ
jgi:hypothetical protein